MLTQASGAKELHLVGRSKNQKLELERDFALETMRVADHNFIQKQVSLAKAAARRLKAERCQKRRHVYIHLLRLEWNTDIIQLGADLAAEAA